MGQTTIDVSHEHYKDRWLLIISAQASPPTSGLVAICTPAWRGGARTISLLLPDRVKNVDSHEGQEMHALHQQEMLTLDSLMVEPHIRRASSSEHDAAINGHHARQGMGAAFLQGCIVDPRRFPDP